MVADVPTRAATAHSRLSSQLDLSSGPRLRQRQRQSRPGASAMSAAEARVPRCRACCHGLLTGRTAHSPSPNIRHIRSARPAPRPDRANCDARACAAAAAPRSRPAAKLEAVAAQRGTPVIVVNAAEGEPLEQEGQRADPADPAPRARRCCARRGGARRREAIIAIADDDLERTALAAATPSASAASRPTLRSSRDGSCGFVTGEETRCLERDRGPPAKPTLKPPFPFERGLDGRPTLVQNVETLAHSPDRTVRRRAG